MKHIAASIFTFFICFHVNAQFSGHGIGNIEIYFGDMLEQQKWDFDKEYRWSFYLCADEISKLSSVQNELSTNGFDNFQILPEAVTTIEGDKLLSMLVFEKTTVYIPRTLLEDIKLLYTLEKKYQLSSFDDYGNYELMEEINNQTSAAASSKKRVF